MRNVLLVGIVAIEVLLSPAPLPSGQGARTLSVAGHSGYTKILELDGKSYISVEDLARLTLGSLSFNAAQIILTLPGGPPTRAAGVPEAKRGFSKEFLQAGIEQMSAIREWRIMIVNSIQNNFPASEESISELQRRADTNLALAASSRSTQDDRDAYGLLQAESKNMQKLSDGFLTKRKKLQYIDPKSVANDRLDQQILGCARSLASMAADNQFRDEPLCSEVR
jgi:hypothetical protein